MDGVETAAWFGAIATFLAVVIALFKEDIIGLWRRPRLRARIELGPPDCQKMPTYLINTETREIRSTVDSYYFRIWVENVGRLKAEWVQVFACELNRRQRDGTFMRVGSFLPMNLKWAHSDHVFADALSPGMGRHCDLAHIHSPDWPTIVPVGIVLELHTEVPPSTQGNILGPGFYQLKLKIAASNCSPVEKELQIEFSGTWYEGEADMFTKGINIMEVD